MRVIKNLTKQKGGETAFTAESSPFRFYKWILSKLIAPSGKI